LAQFNNFEQSYWLKFGGFILGPNPNFFLSHMALYVAQIWRQNFRPKQEKRAKVNLGPNYKTWTQLTTLNLHFQMKSIYIVNLDLLLS
jgi:hypothetical protein